ncbi:uncharacterized protein PV09_05771 [Verruconis gallopava]|uniref:Uncharacterized protein n=1 Tax=Verruconis gallopava TaxID=253628 RepID=A0A0D2AVG5_9PEZI|nr:uncharacterized protein PV09_05771 [Verruconis gallopava]KIW03129.1 hypothetical protein PV09_05771 [Verruconis gallopava]
MEPNLLVVAGAGAVFGLLAHWFWFIRGEHMKWIRPYALTIIFGPGLAAAGLCHYLDLTFLRACLTVLVAIVPFCATLFSSIAIYRLYFHPLRNFPGPPAARLTQFAHVREVAAKCDNFRHLDKLHAQYGEYVRAGPNLLSIADPDWVEPVHKAQTKFEKSEWYDGGYPMTTLHQMRDKAMHDRRRRHGWDQAFTTKSLRAYDSRLIKYADTLVDQIRKRSGEVVNGTSWLNYLAFDVMGDMAFGRSFEALEKGESHFYIDLIHNSAHLIGMLGTVSWILQVLRLFPISWTAGGRMLLYSEQCVDERRKYEPKEPDVMSHIFAAGDFFKGDKKMERLLLMGDSRLLIVAGSDTTATTLIYLFYHLAKDPSLVEKLRAELKEKNIENNESLSVSALQYVDYLNALINETLRMHPPVPGGVSRLTPRDGVVINGQHLPGGVQIIGPHYTIQRSPRAFVKPNEFIPERWTTKPELILNKNAFFPFSIGKFSCIGKQFALNELRTVVTKMVLEFDVAFAPGEDGTKLLTESKDVFTMSNAELRLIWTERTKKD